MKCLFQNRTVGSTTPSMSLTVKVFSPATTGALWKTNLGVTPLQFYFSATLVYQFDQFGHGNQLFMFDQFDHFKHFNLINQFDQFNQYCQFDQFDPSQLK